MHPRELLIDTSPHIPPAKALEQLAASDAERRLPGAPHSIAEIVAHLTFWQAWFCQRCEGASLPPASSAAEGWPSVAVGDWPDLQARFLAGLERAAAGGDGEELDRPLQPPIAWGPLAHYTRRDALVHVASHNAHHLGQVVLLRQLMGLWPPPAGSWTW